jgi:hypothetical protein
LYAAGADLTVIGLGIVSQIYFWRMISYLRSFHINTWIDLGYPKFIARNNSFVLFGFILFRKYAKLNDANLDRLGDTALALTVSAWVGFGLLFLIPHQHFTGSSPNWGTWNIWV